jgi:hypothetical protein
MKNLRHLERRCQHEEAVVSNTKCGSAWAPRALTRALTEAIS